MNINVASGKVRTVYRKIRSSAAEGVQLAVGPREAATRHKGAVC